MTFDEWFENQSYDIEIKNILEKCWNASRETYTQEQLAYPHKFGITKTAYVSNSYNIIGRCNK